jgi:hypothetical protein
MPLCLDDRPAGRPHLRAPTTRASASWPPLNAALIATESARPRWTTLRVRLDCRKSISRQGSLADQIVEAILHTADHARRDPLTRHVIDPDGTSLGKRMIASGTTETCRAEMWDPLLDAAVANNELPSGLPRSDIHLWLGNVTVMVMRGLENGEGDVRRYRSILRRFVAPAFASAKAKAGVSKRPSGRHTRSRG